MTVKRVLIVEDSLTVRSYLTEVVRAEPELELVGTAGNGKEAIELTKALRPDVISMDMMLPIMTGLTATEYIMAYQPTPILIVSASTNRGELFKTYDALSAGAVDVLEKPRDVFDPAWPQHYVTTLKRVSRIKVITHPRALLKQREEERSARVHKAPGFDADHPRCIAIGASTGGPAAVRKILSDLPADFPIPILMVIHIGPSFGSAMAEWLDAISPVHVVSAEEGMPMPEKRKVVLAPDTFHLVVSKGRLHLNSEAERHSCRPSVDVLFESVAKEFGPAAIAVLLTGIGRDGAKGMLAIREAGGITIAQDQATSLIYGMPGEAVSLGAAERVLPLDSIGPMLLSLTEGGE